MRSIKSVQDAYCTSMIEDQDIDLSGSKELSEANHPLLIAYWQHVREIKGAHNRFDDLNKNTLMAHQFTRRCEHNLVFFLMVTGQFKVLLDLFKPKSKLKRSKSLRQRIKKRRRRCRHLVAANQKEFSFRPKLIHSAKKVKIHSKSTHDEAMQALALKALSQGINRYSFFSNNDSSWDIDDTPHTKNIFELKTT